MPRKLLAVMAVVAILVSYAATAPYAEVSKYQGFDRPIPVDPAVRIGELENGLRYYIMVNGYPENRAELRLVINAGSVLEDEDQRGLAHFVEHMAFNGTTNFEKNELIDYLRSIGMRFGSDVNAYTSFDETVYKLTVPTDTLRLVERAFLVLEDWAHGIAFDPVEVDKERGVIVEEWRIRLGARKRLNHKHYPVLFAGSKYAERMPIGQMEVVENASAETLRRFYDDWYRPDLMGVVAVGDFDPDWIEGLIKRHFAYIEGPSDPRPRKVFPVPDHEEPFISIATDPEATDTSVRVYYKRDVSPMSTLEDYRRGLVEWLFALMIRDRLVEIERKPDPPFIGAGFPPRPRRIVRSKECFSIGASMTEAGVLRGLEALLTELERVRRHGFTLQELELAKKTLLNLAERMYARREKTSSFVFVKKCGDHFLGKGPLVSLYDQKELYERIIPGITIEEINGVLESLVNGGNRVLLVSAPEKTDLAVPGESELMGIFETVASKEIGPYEFEGVEEPLLAEIPEGGSIVEEGSDDDLGTVEWRLSNGIRVILMPTELGRDELDFIGWSPGGRSLVSDDDFESAMAASRLVEASGVGPFDKTALRKKLTGRSAGARPFIGSLYEGIQGGSSVKDAETMFQLLYLYSTSAVIREEAYEAYLDQQRIWLENEAVSPERALQDTLEVTMAQYHPRKRPMTEATLEEIDLERMKAVYRDRFADFGDYTFIFVGNLDLEAMRPLVETYIGALPATGREETWRDVGSRYPKGVIKKTIRMGMEPKSIVRIAFSGDFDWSPENERTLMSMADVLRDRLRETLREDLSGTYGAFVGFDYDRLPHERYRIDIGFGCEPERVEELVDALFTEIEKLCTQGPDSAEVETVREIQRRSYEQRVKRNGYWQRGLFYSLFHCDDPHILLDEGALIESVTADMIRDAARRYFDTDNYVQVVLMPEETEE